MLSSNLLLVKRVGDEILPQFLESSESGRLLAERVTAIFADNLGRRKKEIQSLLRDMEGMVDWDFRVIRGLGSIVERQSEFVQVSSIDPMVVREFVFRASSQAGIPQQVENRMGIIASVAQEIQVAPEEIESALYADLDENLVLRSLSAPSPGKLIDDYNLSLTQTLLFKCSQLTLTTGNWKGIFRALGGLGLMYTVTRKAGVFIVKVDGPLSVIRQTTRYGTRLARLLPSITNSEDWSIDAEIIEGTRGGRVRHLRLNSDRHRRYLPSVLLETEITFDSDVERDFATRFMARRTGWELVREPGPLQTGDTVMIPDFVFKKHDVEVYLEIAGFWTPEYLARKLKKTRLLEEVDLILAVDKTNLCDDIGDLPRYVSVVFYKGKVSLSPILKHLRVRENEIRKAHRERLSGMEIDIQSSSISIADLARQMEVDADALCEHLKDADLGDHVLLVDVLVSKATLGRISELLAERLKEGPLPLSEATQLIRQHGGTGSEQILTYLGYTTDWSTLDVDEALVTKGTQQPPRTCPKLDNS